MGDGHGPQATSDHLLWSASMDLSAPTTLAGRYRLERPLGSGGGGDVFAAWDLIEDRAVAVKRFRAVGAASDARVRRELAALRLLDLPGVVRVLDEGQHGGLAFVVMELVEGRPFPGDLEAATWQAIEGPTTALLHVLARVHDAGVVHRDIKPSNVLVTAAGDPVLLDFGLARGQAVGSTITRQGTVLGTPRYLAPEQLRGERAGPRADLYALGVMLYEVLAGRPPHDIDGFEGLWRAKLTTVPVPLHRLVADLPRQVSDLVAQLLAIPPSDRPASAAAALDSLGAPEAGPTRSLPWLGGREVVDALVAAGAEGRALDVVGGRGSGRSTALREAAHALQLAGHQVAWALQGSVPFESLASVIGGGPSLAQAGKVPVVARQRLDTWLSQGGVLIVDGLDQVDLWSRGLLEAAQGAVLTGVSDPREGRARVVVEPLTESELRALFWGPERILHLPSDGAHQLHKRTRGVPGLVLAELRAWTAAGLCTWEDGRLRIDRTALDRLRAGLKPRVALSLAQDLPALEAVQRELLAWIQLAGTHARPDLLAQVVGRARWQLDLELAELQSAGIVRRDETGSFMSAVDHDLAAGWPGSLRRDAHRALAQALPLGAEGRLFHVLAGGLVDMLAEEAVATARHQRVSGRVGEAEATLREAAHVLRRERDIAGEAVVIGPLVRAAVAVNTRRAMERACYEVERALKPRPELVALCQAALAARRGESERALAATAALGRLADGEAELARQHIRMLAAQRTPERAEAVLDELRSLSEETRDEELRALVPGWEGLLRYRQGRFAEAAALHEQSAARRTHDLGRLSSRVNVAIAWLEACALDRAEAAARQVVAEAHAMRAPYFELRGEWVLRSVRASRRDGALPDLELVEAAEALGSTMEVGVVCSTEAVIAWHAGEPEACARLARLAADAMEAAGSAAGRLFADAVQAMADPSAEVDAQGMAERACRCPIPGLGLDALGMLAAGQRLAGDWSDQAHSLASRVPSSTLDVPRGMLTVAEALTHVAVAAGGRSQ